MIIVVWLVVYFGICIMFVKGPENPDFETGKDWNKRQSRNRWVRMIASLIASAIVLLFTI